MPLTENKKGSSSSSSSFSSPLSYLPRPPNDDEDEEKKGKKRLSDDKAEDNPTVTTTTTVNSNLLPLLDPSGSIGSLLLQMQKREEALKKLNKTLPGGTDLMEDQFTNLSANSTTLSSGSTDISMDSAVVDDDDDDEEQVSRELSLPDDLFSWMLPKQQQQPQQQQPPEDDSIEREGRSYISLEEARELDNAVSIRLSNSVRDVTVLEMPELYQTMLSSTVNNEEKVLPKQNNVTTVVTEEEEKGAPRPKRIRMKRKQPSIVPTETINEEDILDMDDELPPLSRREHYEGHIGRDMRHLAVSIASCVDDVSEWRLFCQQATGGVEPLIQCIRDGAKSIRDGPWNQERAAAMENYRLSPRGSAFTSGGDTSTSSGAVLRNEEAFEVASSACRALRDLCALSLDLAVVITDGLLRANAGFQSKGEPSLLEDLCILLRYADDSSTDTNGKSRKRRLITKLHLTQLLLAMTCASDSAVQVIRATEGLQAVLVASSSYAKKERRRRWLRYPGELIKYMWLSRRKKSLLKSRRRRPFIEATSLTNDLNGKIQGTANQVLAAIGYNEWVPKIPGQKGLRILCLDGGGSRGMTSVVALKCLVEALDGVEVSDCFDLVVGTSTGAIIAFLVGLNRETSEQAVERYDVLIEKIFTKSAFSTPMLLFTTASYDESPFMNVLSEILGDNTMLDSRADPAVPFVFAVTSKMSSTPTHIALFRNYNYNGNELPDPFMIDPKDARESLGLPLESESDIISKYEYLNDAKRKPNTTPGSRNPSEGSRNPGSFRVLQRYALRASTAAPTVFKPVMMGGEMYCDGGIVASNPSAIAIHEARNIFPNVPIELVVSLGTGGFLEQKSEPRIGWDGIISQIVNSATDGEQIHHILEDVLGDGGTTTRIGRSYVSNTRYMRFNPTLGLPDEFPIDVTDPEKLSKIKSITRSYMEEPEQQRKLEDLADLLQVRSKKKKNRFFGIPSWSRSS